MVGHELKVKKELPFDEKIYLSQNQHDRIHKYNIIDEKFRGILEALPKGIEYVNSGQYGVKHDKKKLDSEAIRGILSGVSFDLLNHRSSSENECDPLAREIRDIEHLYKNVMEVFLCKMEMFLHSIKKLRKDLIRTVQQFNMISRYTAGVTLVSSATEVAFLAGSALQAVFHYSWSPRMNLFSTVLGSTSIVASFVALWYMKQCTTDISRHVKHENRFFTDLTILHRKGNWIDEEVLKLFPHGINLSFFEKELEKGSKFDDKMAWRIYLCSVIILTNIQKETKLLKDEDFLTRVKMFVESQAAEIWWQRIKMKKLLDGMLKKMDAMSSKEFIADHAVHYNRTAVHLYPVLIRWLVTSWNSTGTRFFCSTIAATLALENLTNKETEEFEELKKISQKFEQDFKEITDICNTLDNDYD